MKTALYERHLALKAKMVDFAGWQMPVHYKGTLPEHHAVRRHAGVFDVSHMGRIEVRGLDAEKLLESISTNKIAGKTAGSATYTVWCHPTGGSVDDVMVYKIDGFSYFVVVNAANRQKDFVHLQSQAKGLDVQITPLFDGAGILAVQGPKAAALVAKRFPQAAQLAPMHFIEAQPKIFIAATGYTGAGGLEIYAQDRVIIELWDFLLAEGVEPIGLGARDTLRLEKGYALYGHELSDDISPLESVSAWTVKMDKQAFIGKAALEAQPKRSAYGIVLLGKRIAREGYKVYKGEELIGRVTSGTHSPTLDCAIALILVEKDLTEGDLVEIQIRQNRVPGKVVALPFVT